MSIQISREFAYKRESNMVIKAIHLDGIQNREALVPVTPNAIVLTQTA